MGHEDFLRWQKARSIACIYFVQKPQDKETQGIASLQGFKNAILNCFTGYRNVKRRKVLRLYKRPTPSPINELYTDGA